MFNLGLLDYPAGQCSNMLQRKNSSIERIICDNEMAMLDLINGQTKMPIWKKTPVKDEVSANADNESDFTKNVRNARKSSIDASTYNLKSRSRSSSRTRMNSASRSSLNSKLW